MKRRCLAVGLTLLALIAFALLGVVCVGLILVGAFYPFTGEASAVRQAPFLLAAVAGGSFWIYYRVVKIRVHDLDG